MDWMSAASSTRRREEWSVGLQFFLSSRLRTPSFQVASATHPLIRVPALLPHTQHLLDGIVWSLNDHPEWSEDVWPIVLNHVRDVDDRYQETMKQLAVVKRSEQESASAVTRLYREREYCAHARLQDVYLAFCVVDAFLKHVVQPDKKLYASIIDGLPQLVADRFPVFLPGHSIWERDAIEEFRFHFLNLLRSWRTLRTLPVDVHRRLEEHIRHRLKSSGGAGSGGRAVGEAVRDGLKVLMTNLNGTTTSSQLSQSQSSIASRTPAEAEGQVRSFLSSIFPPRRSAAARVRCGHCGAPLKDEAARNEHYRYHFHAHNFLSSASKVVRLLYPTPSDFVAHAGDAMRDGYYPKVVDVLEDAYRHGERGIVSVRRLEATKINE